MISPADDPNCGPNDEIDDREPQQAQSGNGWHSRGYLPHYDSQNVTQHVTFHLADSLPRETLERLEDELKAVPAQRRPAERRIRLEGWMDAGHGSCVLQYPEVASMVQGMLLHFDGHRYRLLAWVIMPNHIHVLFEPANGWTIAKIVASWKKYSAREISGYRRTLPMAIEASSKPVWHREYWDRFIRSDTHFRQAAEYIHQNPVKAGLVARPELWRWSSASHGLRLADGLVTGTDANREIGVPRAG